MSENKMKATSSELEALHGLVVRDLISKAEERQLTAQELSVAAKILKDNEIKCDDPNKGDSDADFEEEIISPKEPLPFLMERPTLKEVKETLKFDL